MRYSDNDIIVHSDDEYDDDEDFQGDQQQLQPRKQISTNGELLSVSNVGASNKFQIIRQLPAENSDEVIPQEVETIEVMNQPEPAVTLQKLSAKKPNQKAVESSEIVVNFKKGSIPKPKSASHNMDFQSFYTNMAEPNSKKSKSGAASKADKKTKSSKKMTVVPESLIKEENQQTQATASSAMYIDPIKNQPVMLNQLPNGLQIKSNLDQEAQVKDEEQCSFDSSDWEEVQSTQVVIDSSDYVDYAAIYYNSLQNKMNKLKQQQKVDDMELFNDASLDLVDQSHDSSIRGAIADTGNQDIVYQSGPVIRTDDISSIELGQSLVDQIFSKQFDEDNQGFDQEVSDKIHIGNFNADQSKPSKKITWQKGQLVPVGGTSLILELTSDPDQTQLSLLYSNQTQLSLQSKVCKAATKIKKAENYLRKIPTQTLQNQTNMQDCLTHFPLNGNGNIEQSFYSYAAVAALKNEQVQMSGSVLGQKRDQKGQKKKRRKLTKWKKRKNMIVEKVVAPSSQNQENNNKLQQIKHSNTDTYTHQDSNSYVQTATNTTIVTNAAPIEQFQNELEDHNNLLQNIKNMDVLREKTHYLTKKEEDDSTDVMMRNHKKLLGEVEGDEDLSSCVLANSDQPLDVRGRTHSITCLVVQHTANTD